MRRMLTAAQQTVIERVEQLTRAKCAPRAAHYDAIAANPVESWRDLWAEGFLAMAIPLEAARLFLYQAARHSDDADVSIGGLLANKAKSLATQVGLQVTATAIQVVGGWGTLRDLPVEPTYRDLHTCTLMPPTVSRIRSTVGKSVLGVEVQLFNCAVVQPISAPSS